MSLVQLSYLGMYTFGFLLGFGLGWSVRATTEKYPRASGAGVDRQAAQEKK